MRVIFACWFLFLVPAALLAEVGFIHESGFSFPAFPPSASKVNFVDYDLDGSREFLAVSETLVVLYEINSDSAIFVHYTDSLRPHTQAIVADVNGDAIFDIVLVVSIPDTHAVYPTPTDWRIICYDGASEYKDSSEVMYHSDPAFSTAHGSIDLDLLSSIDIDGDGINELIYSFSDASYSQWNSSEGGHTVAYERFPDSLQWTKDFRLTQIFPISYPDDSVRTLCRDYSSWSMELGPDTGEDDALLYRIESYGTLKGLTPACVDSFCDGGGGYNSCSYLSTRAGDIDASNPGDELFSIRYSGFWCPYDAGSRMLRDMQLYRPNPTDLLGPMEQLWSIPMPPQLVSPDNIIVHPNLPGYFFGFVNDTLFMFRGENGSIRSSIAAPTGQRYWETNWPDSVPRLVVINGHQVDIYSLDISTDSENDVDPVLPRTFTLGQPYPNPFNAVVAIPVDLSARAHLKVEVFNLLGQPVEVIADQEQPAGKAKFEWDASGNSSGVYLIRASAGDNVLTAKLLLLK